MQEQNYANHRQFVPAYHFVLSGILILTLIGSIVNLYESFDNHERLYNASLIVLLVVSSMLITALFRMFALKAQDRAIRAEENLRHYVLTGKLLDARLSVLQIVALRFAGDEEFAALAVRAAAESLSPDVIKRAVEHWRADTYRV
jgi:L-asparagine transporter-like permease